MKHLSQGEMRAYLDQALSVTQRQRAVEHLEICARCRSQAQALEALALHVRTHLSSLEPESAQSLPPVSAARAQLVRRISESEKEQQNMWNRLTTRVPRAAWAALAVVAVLAISLAFEPVRAVASSFLGLFRVERIQVIEIDPEAVSHQFESASDFEALLADEMQFEEFGELQEAADAAEASQLAGFSLRLPEALGGKPKFIVQPGSRAAFTVDMELVNAVLQEIGRSDIRLPADLHGAKIEVEVPTGVAAMYGDCEPEPAPPPDPDAAPRPVRIGPRDCTTLMQLPSPTISAPPGLDMTGIGEAYLQILGLTPEEAESMARNVDWTTTFVVPMPRHGVEYQDVQVDGVTGTLLWQTYREEYVLVWVKYGMLYALSGPGEAGAALEIAESLK